MGQIKENTGQAKKQKQWLYDTINQYWEYRATGRSNMMSI